MLTLDRELDQFNWIMYNVLEVKLHYSSVVTLQLTTVVILKMLVSGARVSCVGLFVI